MDAHLFRRVTDTLIPLLLKARLEKIQSLSEDVYTFVFYTKAGKRQLCFRFGRQHSFLFLAQHTLSAGTAPTAPVMRLRKYLQGHHVIASVAEPFHRKLWLFFDTQDEVTLPKGTMPTLVFDLREGVFLKESTPEEIPEETVAWPHGHNLEEALEQWQQWPVLTPDLRRTLVHMDPKDAMALVCDLKEGSGDIFLYTNPETQDIVGIYAWPLPKALQKNAIETSGSDVCALLEQAGQQAIFATVLHAQEKEAQRQRQQKLKKLKRLKKNLQDEEERLRAMCQKQDTAILLQQNLWRFDPSQKVKELVLPQYNPEESETLLRLDPQYTIQENMERLFHQAKRGKRGLIHLEERKEAMEAAMKDLTLLTSPTNQQGKAPTSFTEITTLPDNVQGFCSSDGFLLLRGRNNAGNLACRKIAKGHDVWLHVTDGPGAHVIIRLSWPGQEIPEQTLIEAGTLAACKSWQQNSTSALIQYAEIRHIKPMKGAAKGTVKIDKLLFTRNVPVDHTLETTLALPAAKRPTP
ncbi:MAG: DUF814 domain-containing protein [Desulfovibrio sp.]|nr:DUF814 domain-containing protein [Desulfovibrio sp.]